MSLLTMEHFLLMFLVAVASSNKIKLQCAPGSYVLTPRIGPDICRWCTDGVNFIPRYPEFWHSNRTCLNCTQVRDENLEVLVSPCNKTHDAEILCRNGYYRYKARNVREKDTCVKCSHCDNIARPCQGNHDHVCCLPSYEVVLNKHGFYECKERPLVCGAGKFLSLKTEQCTPCPSGTFMTSDKHNHSNCQICQTLDDVALNHKILQPCNRTHPAIFRCKEGYYKFVSDIPNEAINICQPCMKCGNQKHEVKKCDRFQDTVCCDWAEMIVQDTDQGLRCLSVHLPDNFNNTWEFPQRIAVFEIVTEVDERNNRDDPECGTGEHLQTDPATNQIKCYPCLSSPCEITATQPRDTQPDTADLPGRVNTTNIKALSITGLIIMCLLLITNILCLIYSKKLNIFQVIKDKRSKKPKVKSSNPLPCTTPDSLILDKEETDTRTTHQSTYDKSETEDFLSMSYRSYHTQAGNQKSLILGRGNWPTEEVGVETLSQLITSIRQ